MVFAEYLVRGTIPPVELTGKHEFYLTIVRQLRRTVLTSGKVLRYDWSYTLPREIGQ